MDFRYRRRGGELYAEMPFALFLAGLRPHFDGLVLLGRASAADDPVPHRLPDGVELAELPGYESAASPLAVARALPGTVRAVVGTLRQYGHVVCARPRPPSPLPSGPCAQPFSPPR